MAAAGSSGGEEVLQNSARRERKRRSGRRSRDQDSDVRLSKALSYALRHGAEILSLHMSSDGFVDLEEILRLPQFKAWSEEDVKRVVETNEKQRFALCRHPSSGHLQIRANQGHSLQVPELELTPLQELQDFPETVAHGTLLRHWPAIRQHGLSRMGRTHIHLAPGLPAEGAILSGMRNSSEVAIILDIPKALADGISFFRSANGVILSPGNAEGLLLPRYFSRALQLRPRRSREASAASGGRKTGLFQHFHYFQKACFSASPSLQEGKNSLKRARNQPRGTHICSAGVLLPLE